MTKPLVRLAAVLVTMVAARSWALTFEPVYSFPADESTGKSPGASLTVGPDGSLYGTTTAGGSDGSGTAFKVTTDGAFSVLGHFEKSTTGSNSTARLTNIGDGFLYGATEDNSGTVGVNYGGTVFKLDPAGGSSALSVVFNLPGDGIGPQTPVAVVSGESNVLHVLGSAPGGVWRVPLDGGMRTIASAFPSSGDEGQFPRSLVRGLDGKFYGTTEGTSFSEGLPGRRGTLFRVDGNGSNRTNLFDFHYDTSGAKPAAAMVLDSDTGVFYGVTASGGTFGDGVFFRFDPASHTPGTLDTGLTVLKNLDDVSSSVGDLLLASDGKIYATCKNLDGNIWRINKDGSGFQKIHVFNGTNGRVPIGGLVQAGDGNLYGTTSAGGSGNNGTIFRIDLGLEPPPVNRAPIAVDDYQNSSGAPVYVSALANDFDPNEDPNTDEIEEPLTVTLEDPPAHGTASPEVGGQFLYSPGPTYAGSDQFTYRLTDPDGLFSIGTVYITNQPIPEPWEPGVYNGILNLDPNLEFDNETPRAQLIINVSELGLFTGKLITGKKRLKVRGFFGEDDTGIAFVKIPKKGTAIIFLTASQAKSLNVYFFGQELWTGYISRLPIENPPPKAKLTLALPVGDPNTPIGSGYGIGRVLSNGLVVAVGKLGDGSKLAWGTTFVDEGGSLEIPVFNEPVKGGVLAGNFYATGGIPTYAALGLRWIRPSVTNQKLPYPGGFTGNVSGVMEIYTPPPRGVLPVDFGTNLSGFVELTGPSATPSVGGVVQVAGTRIVPSEDADNPVQSLSINKATGLFSGKMKLNGKSVSFKGAVIQSVTRGWGYYTIDKVTGSAELIAD